MRAEGHSFCFSYNIFAGGRRGCRGAPSTEALPCNPGKRTSIACAWAPLWAAGVALTSVHFSSHFVLRHSFVSDIARAETFPLTDHLILFYMPFLMSGMFGTKTFIPFSLIIIIIIILLILLSLALALAFCRIYLCVCVCHVAFAVVADPDVRETFLSRYAHCIARPWWMWGESRACHGG